MAANPSEPLFPNAKISVEMITAEITDNMEKVEPSNCKSVQESGKYRQIAAAFIMNIGGFIYGMVVGWTSPMIPQLQSENSPIGGPPISDEIASWLGGFVCIGALIGTPVFGTASEKFGRKVSACLVAIPLGICWLIKVFATDQNYLFAARCFGGFGGAGVVLVIPLYVAEMASIKIRGTLGSFLVFFINIGVVVGYILGALVSFRVFAICASVLPMIYLSGIIFLPETPIYLVRKERMADARRSLLWLRGGNREVADRELIFLNTIAKESIASQRKVGFRDLFKNRATIKGLAIAFFLFGGQQFCGIFAMISYSSTIFEASGSTLAPNTAAIIIGVIQVFASYLSLVLMDRAGRRFLVLISCAGMGLCHFTIGSFSYFQIREYEVSSFAWIPLVAFSIYVVMYALGMGPAPYIVATEIFSPEISGLANSVSLLLLWASAFVVLKFFSNVVALVGMDGCFFLFAAFCACTFILSWFMLPETKGRSIDSILEELDGKSSGKSLRKCGKSAKQTITLGKGDDAGRNNSKLPEPAQV